MAASKLPFNRPFIAGKELFYIAQAVTYGNLSGDGHFTRDCCRLIEERFGIGKVLLVPSCTAALEMAAMLFNLQEGDEVIVPSFTFVSTVNAFVRLGARPVFVDIRPDTLMLCVLMTLGIGLLSTFIPAYRASRQRITDGLRQV